MAKTAKKKTESINKPVDPTKDINYEEDFKNDLSEIDKKEELLDVLEDTIEYEFTNKGRHIPRTMQVLIALVKNHL